MAGEPDHEWEMVGWDLAYHQLAWGEMGRVRRVLEGDESMDKERALALREGPVPEGATVLNVQTIMRAVEALADAPPRHEDEADASPPDEGAAQAEPGASWGWS